MGWPSSIPEKCGKAARSSSASPASPRPVILTSPGRTATKSRGDGCQTHRPSSLAHAGTSLGLCRIPGLADLLTIMLRPGDHLSQQLGGLHGTCNVNDRAVKKCLWCGRENPEAEPHCLECGTAWDSREPAASPTFSTDLLQIFVFSVAAVVILQVFLAVHKSDRSYRIDGEPFKWIVLGFFYSVGRVCFLVSRIVSRWRKGTC